MNAYLALEATDRWFFAGYSLPAEDLAIKSLLYRALEARRAQRRETQVIVVSKSAQPERRKVLRARFSNLFKPMGCSVKYEWTSFKNYVEEKLPASGGGRERWTPSAGQLIDVAKWNLLRYIPVKMRGAEDDKEETAKPFASL